MIPYKKSEVKRVSAEDLNQFIMSRRHLLDYPAVLEGHELNSHHKPWDQSPDGLDYKMRFIVCVPTEYNAGVSNMGQNIVYDMLSRDPEVLCERAFLPEKKLMRMLEKENYPLGFSLESKHSFSDFDVIGFSSYFELQFVPMIKMIHASGIPLYASERDESHPLIFVGGISAYSSVPIDQMVDLVFIGDGEVQLPFFKDKVAEYKQGLITKDELLRWFAFNVPGCYVPKFYDFHYKTKEDGSPAVHIDRIEVRPEYSDVAPLPVKKSLLDLAISEPFYKSVLPAVDGNFIGYNSVEIARGCHSSCRFCMAGYVNKPYREHTLDKVKATMKKAQDYLGSKSFTPYSLNYAAYSQQSALATAMVGDLRKSVTTAAQRADSFCPDVADVLSKHAGTKTATLAPEGGSQRMRDVINKEVTEEDIKLALKSLIKSGYRSVKLYMISNLPFETAADRMEIIDVLREIHEYRLQHNPKMEIRVSYTEFTAKPFTPLQYADVSDWTDRLTPEGVYDALSTINVKYRRSISGINHFLLQLFNRVDRRFNDVFIDAVVNYGVMFNEKIYAPRMTSDQIEDLFADLTKKYIGVDMMDYLREMPPDTIFPWDVFSVGFTKDYLPGEYLKAKHFAAISPSCYHKCTMCGVCTDEQLQEMGATFPFYHHRQDDLDKEQMISAISQIDKEPTPNKVIVRLNIPHEQREHPPSKYKIALKAAFSEAGLNLKEKVDLLSEQTQWDNWVHGVDVAVLRTASPTGQLTKKQLEVVNQRLEGLITVDGTQVYPAATVKSMGTLADKCLYHAKIVLPQGLSPDDVARTNELLTFRQKAKNMEVAGRITYVPREGHVTTILTPIDESLRLYNIYVILAPEYSVYDVLQALLKLKNKRDILVYPIERLAFFRKPTTASVLVPKCSCGSIREVDLFGKPLHRECLACNISDGSIRRTLVRT